MEKNINMYEGLAAYVLPSGVLLYYELTDIAEASAQETNVLYSTKLHIYLEEREIVHHTYRVPQAMAFMMSLAFLIYQYSYIENAYALKKHIHLTLINLSSRLY